MSRADVYVLATIVVLSAEASAFAQVLPLDCLPASTGPNIGSQAPYPGGMCDLGGLFEDSRARSQALAVSANGGTVVGTATTAEDTSRAYRWTSGVGFLDLGTLQTDNLGISSATSVSSNGTVIAGTSTTDAGYNRAFRWTEELGMQELGVLSDANEGNSTVSSMSDDGAVIVGSSATNDGSRAYRWTETLGMQDLGTLRDGNVGLSTASAISKDGNFVIGRSQIDDFIYWHAFRWSQDTGMEDLGTLADDDLGNSFAFSISANGGVVVGEATANSSGDTRAFRWSDDGNGMLDLGSLLGANVGRSTAYAVSANGAVIIGDAVVDADNNSRAFRWSDASVGMVDLGSLRTDNGGQSVAYAISADGAVIGGSAETDSGHWRAFRWIDDGTGMLDLGTLRADNLGSSYVDEISADGSVIVGAAETDQGTERAFIWRTQMQDFTNMILSFDNLANDTEIAVAQQQGVLGQLLDETCQASEGQSCFRTSGWLSVTGGTSAQGIDNQASGIGTLTFGRGLNEMATVGGTISANSSELSTNGFDLQAGMGANIWAQYNQNAVSRVGLQFDTSVGFNDESGQIIRGRGLEDVMLASGEAGLQTFGARATLAYAFKSQNWLITPSTTLSQFRSSRSAYTEEGSDFNASYDELVVDHSIATLALSAERKVSVRGTLSIEAEIDQDLSRDKVALTGTSNVIGMEDFSVPSSLSSNKTRWELGFGYRHDLTDTRSISGNVNAGQATFGTAIQTAIGASYDVKF